MATYYLMILCKKSLIVQELFVMELKAGYGLLYCIILDKQVIQGLNCHALPVIREGDPSGGRMNGGLHRSIPK